MRILHAVTAPETARAFLAGQLSDLVDKGHDVHLVCSPGEALASIDPRVRNHAVAMRREPQATTPPPASPSPQHQYPGPAAPRQAAQPVHRPAQPDEIGLDIPTFLRRQSNN